MPRQSCHNVREFSGSLAKLENLAKGGLARRYKKVLFPIDYRCCRSTRDAHMRALSSDPIVQYSLTIPKRRLRSGVIGKPVRTIERSEFMPRRTIRSTRFKHRYQSMCELCRTKCQFSCM